MKVTTRKYFNIEVSIYLDEKYCKKDFTHNVTIMVYQSRKYYHYRTGLSLREWGDITTQEEEKIYKMYNRVYELCKSLYDDDSFSMDALKMKLEAPLTETLSDMLEQRIEQYKLNAQISTMTHYDAAKKVFEGLFGRVPFAKITPAHFQKMSTYMEQEGYSPTTIRIYLSDLKSITTEAIYKGYINETANPFKRSKYDMGKVDIPQTNKRSNCYLSKEDLTVIWNEFLKKKDKMLGLFMFSYLCGGMNIADIVKLKYNDWYYSSKGEEFMYRRSKTQRVSTLQIRIAIDDRIKTILECFPQGEKGGYVFPFLEHCYTPKEIHDKISLINTKVSYRIRKLCKKLGIGDNVTSTWARHSYSTVMNRECVPYSYIEFAMGHAAGNTAHYFGGFTTAQMREFNQKLLAS